MTDISHANPFQAGAALLRTGSAPAQELTADITWIIGASLSMRLVWEDMRGRMKELVPMFRKTLTEERFRQLPSLRLRIIAFRDMYMDSEAFDFSSFLDVRTQGAALRKFVGGVRPAGGGIPRKSGMEALFCALHGDWRRDPRGNCHVLCMVTDAAAYLPEDPQRRMGRFYKDMLSRFTADPCEAMPDDMDGMRRLWRDGAGTLDNWNSTLVLFAPQLEPWQDIALWPRVSRPFSDPGTIRLTRLETLIKESCRPLQNPGTASP